MLSRVRRACFFGIISVALVLLLSAAGVTEEKLRTAQSDATTWLTYGKNYAGWRYADLTEINRTNVAKLAPRWIFQTGVAGKFETTPLVFDRLLYVTGPSNHAYGLDALTGRPIWHYQKPVPAAVNICCGQVNRGFAALGNKLFKVNLEAKLVALDAKTGAELWESTVDDIKKGYSGTVAPLAVKNLIVIGIAGAEFGRLHLDYGNLRSRAQSDLLGHGQSRAGPERGRSPGRQPLYVQPGRARRRHRQTALALSVHTA